VVHELLPQRTGDLVVAFAATWRTRIPVENE
jgi:hypothetical protein